METRLNGNQALRALYKNSSDTNSDFSGGKFISYPRSEVPGIKKLSTFFALLSLWELWSGVFISLTRLNLSGSCRSKCPN